MINSAWWLNEMCRINHVNSMLFSAVFIYFFSMCQSGHSAFFKKEYYDGISYGWSICHWNNFDSRSSLNFSNAHFKAVNIRKKNIVKHYEQSPTLSLLWMTRDRFACNSAIKSKRGWDNWRKNFHIRKCHEPWTSFWWQSSVEINLICGLFSLCWGHHCSVVLFAHSLQ